MTDREVLRKMVARLGVEPQVARFDQNDNRLVEVQFIGGQLTELPEELFTFNKLRKLSLEDNLIANINPKICELVELEDLRLSHNRILAIPNECALLKNLQLLWLEDNNIPAIPQPLCNLERLVDLRLRHNQLSSLPEGFHRLKHLRRLILASNGFNVWPPEILQLPGLIELRLSGNRLAMIPESIGNLRYLRHLSLYANSITELPPDIGLLTELEKLWLDYNRIVDIPVELSQLTKLKQLRLSGNSLSSLPDGLNQLKRLENLWLDGNNLGDFPLCILGMTELRTLRLSGNPIGSVPDEIRSLSSLRELWLEKNALTVIPPEIGALSQLRDLTLSGNSIDHLPQEFGQLSHLEKLWITDNKLFELPVEIGNMTALRQLKLNNNRFVRLPASLGKLTKLTVLGLSGNPLRTPPPELVQLGTTAVCTYLARLDTTSVIRRESKLLVIGEGRTGKTSLMRALHGLPFDNQIDSTHGIDIAPLTFVVPGESQKEMTLNYWDFGGQQIYHTTHQFFMTTRSLYLLVWNAGTDTDQGRLDHWLRNIQVLAPDARVLLVATHIDQRPADFNLDRFRAAYPDLIVGFAGVSNKTGDGLENLKSQIAEEAAKLPLMEQEWPRAWVQVEEALLALNQTHIDSRAFAAICAAHGITQPYEQQILGSYLHDLGKILYYQDDDILSDFIVLKPNWLTQATARVLDDVITRDRRHGVLEHKDFPRIWQDYERRLYPVFLRMLEKFLISYQLEEHRPGLQQSLVPLLLPHRPPPDLPKWETVLPDQPEVRMVFDMDFVPPGIMSWFVVLTHHYSQDLHWREGVRLQYEGHQADVVLNPSTRQLWLQVRGPVPSNFFNILQHTVNDRIIRKYFEGLTYQRRVPCICHRARNDSKPCPHYYEYDKLVERKQRSRATIECSESYEDVSVAQLLEGIHYSTLDLIDAKVDRVLETVGRNKKLLLEVRQLSEQSLREQSRMWNLLTHNLFSDLPSVFVVVPGERTHFDPRNLFNEEHRLHLLCQHPGEPHIVAGEMGYPAPRDRIWWQSVQPWLRQMIKILKFVPKLSGAAKAYDESWYKTVEFNVELYGALSQTLPDFAEQTDRLVRNAMGPDLTMVPIEAEGAALRSLHVWLREVDKAQHWCGLQKVVTNDGNILWLCPEHANFHGI